MSHFWWTSGGGGFEGLVGWGRAGCSVGPTPIGTKGSRAEHGSVAAEHFVTQLFEFLASGGPVMVPIGLSSVVAFAAFLWRAVAVRQARVVPRMLAIELEELIKQGRFEDALTLCKKQEEVALTRVVRAGVHARGRPRGEVKERLEEVGRRESAELERGAEIIGTVASISPLLGLLGTVWGMIQTFEVIQVQGPGVIGSLAGGISQALITTMAGLSVAIPAVMAHRWLLARVDSLTLDLEDAALRVLDLVSDDGAPE